MEKLILKKSILKKLIAQGNYVVLNALKEAIRSNSEKFKIIESWEDKLRNFDKSRLGNKIEDLVLIETHNKIRTEISTFIDKLTESDFVNPNRELSNSGGEEKGQLLYKIPEQMKVNKESDCLVRIAFTKEKILENLKDKENISLRRLNRISDTMLVTLEDTNESEIFQIRAINELTQVVSPEVYTEWHFMVKPLKVGEFKLTIKAAAIELINGKERKLEFTFFEEVKVITKEVPKEILTAAPKSSSPIFYIGNAYSNVSVASSLVLANEIDYHQHTPILKSQHHPTTSAKASPSLPKVEAAPRRRNFKIPTVAAIIALVIGSGWFFTNQLNEFNDNPLTGSASETNNGVLAENTDKHYSESVKYPPKETKNDVSTNNETEHAHADGTKHSTSSNTSNTSSETKETPKHNDQPKKTNSVKPNNPKSNAASSFYTLDEKGNIVHGDKIKYKKGDYKIKEGKYYDLSDKIIKVELRAKSQDNTVTTTTDSRNTHRFDKKDFIDLFRQAKKDKKYTLSKISFVQNSNKILTFSKEELKALASALKSSSTTKINIEFSPTSNLTKKTRTKREEALGKLLIDLGVSEKQILKKRLAGSENVISIVIN